MSALASFSNWRQRNQPCRSASSTALASMPVPFSEDGVKKTTAPRKRSNLARQTLKPLVKDTQHLAPLVAKAFRHRHDQRITLLGTDHREANARVAARRFDYSLTGLERPTPLGLLDHRPGHTVLDRAHGIEGFDLHVHVGARRRQLVEPHQRGVADRFEDICVTGHGPLCGACRRWGA